MNYIFFIISAVIILQASSSYANPTQTGSTGLLTVPTADTIPSGNVCVGVWGDLTARDDKHAIIMPVGLTIGLGTSWEMYGSYPNIMFNNQEDRSGKGTAELGTKFRFYGRNNSRVKLAADLFGQRTISADPSLDGVSNFGGRLIGSLATEWIGLHVLTGYKFAGDPPGKASYDNELLYGAGIGFSPTSRSKITLEMTGNTNGDKSLENPMEGTVGLQYYLSPHLTFNLAGGVGFTAASPDWRAIVGFSTCQGIGTYVKPIPRVMRPGEKKEEEVVKPMKIIPITPLLMSAAVPAAPVSKLEVQVEPDQETIFIRPTAQVVIPVQSSATSVILPPLGTQLPIKDKVEKTPSEKTKEKPTAVAALPPAEPSVDEILGEGETPLYSIDVKGEQLSIAAANSAPKPEKMMAFRKYRFPDVVFEYNQTEISPEVKKSLSEVAELLRSDKKWTSIRIDAHTDSIGSVNYNMDLSLKRAITIATYLTINEGIDPSRIFIKGMGKTKLIADNATTAGRKVNRRFEILLLTPKDKL